MHDIPCIIFAGGKSRRMGEDKALLPFGDAPSLTQYQLDKFKTHFKEVYISCKSRDKFNFDANFIEDNPHYKDNAPLIGLISVFEQLQCNEIFVLSVDTPFFENSHFEKMLQKRDTTAWATVAKSSNGAEPLCALYKKEVLPVMIEKAAQKAYKLSSLLEEFSIQYIDFSDNEIFTNLNYPAEYQKALLRNQHG